MNGANIIDYQYLIYYYIDHIEPANDYFFVLALADLSRWINISSPIMELYDELSPCVVWQYTCFIMDGNTVFDNRQNERNICN